MKFPLRRHEERAGRARIVLLLALLPVAASATLVAQQIEQASEELTAQILDSLQAEGRSKIAIIEFTDLSGAVTPLGRLIAEELTSELFKQARRLPQGKLTLVERSKLDEVLGEQRLGVRGLLEKRNVETFGRILGVEAILTGTCAILNDRIRINGRLIAVPSAELFATAAGYMSRGAMPDEYLTSEPTAFTSLADAQVLPRSGEASGGSRSQDIQEVSGIRFALLQCKTQSSRVACDIVMTSLNGDTEITFNSAAERFYSHDSISRVIDEDGNEYRLEEIQIGGNVDRRNKASYYGPDPGAAVLVAGVPLKIHLTFAGVPEGVQRLAILELPGRFPSDRRGNFRVQFRGIALLQQ